MKSFNSLVTCGRRAYEAVSGFEMSAERNGLNATIREGAAKVGLTQFDPVEAGRRAVIGDMVNVNQRTNNRGMGM